MDALTAATTTEFVAILTAAIFAGAALYINIVEHPARMSLDTSAAAGQWARSYQRATWMQAPLALVSFVAGLMAWWLTGDIEWAIGAGLIGSVVPFTLLVIQPTNHKLLAPDRDPGSVATRVLLDRWAKLHTVRTILSVAASALYLWRALAT